MSFIRCITNCIFIPLQSPICLFLPLSHAPLSRRAALSPSLVAARARTGLAEPRALTPSVLRLKPTTKSSHEHHIYVIMHVIEGVDKFLVA